MSTITSTEYSKMTRDEQAAYWEERREREAQEKRYVDRFHEMFRNDNRDKNRPQLCSFGLTPDEWEVLNRGLDYYGEYLRDLEEALHYHEGFDSRRRHSAEAQLHRVQNLNQKLKREVNEERRMKQRFALERETRASLEPLSKPLTDEQRELLEPLVGRNKALWLSTDDPRHKTARQLRKLGLLRHYHTYDNGTFYQVCQDEAAAALEV